MSLYCWGQSCMFDFFPLRTRRAKNSWLVIRGQKFLSSSVTELSAWLLWNEMGQWECTVSVTHLVLPGPAVPYVLQVWSLNSSGLQRMLRRLRTAKNQDGSKLEKALHFLARRRRYLKANQFSEHISISEHIYIWIYVGLIKFETENCCCCGEALAAHSNGLV